jgi:hypothetical protein
VKRPVTVRGAVAVAVAVRAGTDAVDDGDWGPVPPPHAAITRVASIVVTARDVRVAVVRIIATAYACGAFAA